MNDQLLASASSIEASAFHGAPQTQSGEIICDTRNRTLAWLMRDISRMYTAVGQKVLAPWGITMAHWYYLRVLEEGPLTQLELSKRVGMASTTAVPVVDYLEKNNLVIRQRDPNDRRKYNVSLTEDGRTLICEVMKIFPDVVSDSVKGASAEEIAVLWKMLLLVESNLSEMAARQGPLTTALDEVDPA